MPRPQDPSITEAALDAAVELLAERGFAGISMDAIAARARVGKPALYRRFRDKGELVAAAVGRALPAMPARDPAAADDLRAHLLELLEQALPADPPGYAALVGGLMAEHRRHPELIGAFREHVLHPRRALVRAAVEDGQRRGLLRRDVDPELAVDLFGGPLLARAFAGLPMDRVWLAQVFDRWWEAVRS